MKWCEIGQDWEHSGQRCSDMHQNRTLIMRLRKLTAIVALALALLTACGDNNPGGNSGPDGGNTETTSSYN